MTSTPVATKRSRFAALSLSTALTVGVLAPFLAASGADAATPCATTYSSYTTANSHLAKDRRKVHHFKKKLKKDKRHHRAAHVIKHDEHKLHHWKMKRNADRHSRNSYTSAYTVCNDQAASASAAPLSSILSQLQGAGLDSSALTDALRSAASQIAASGAPGAAQLAGLLDQLADAIASGSASLDPSQLQDLFSQFAASGFDPSKIQAALTEAAAEFQTALSNPQQYASDPAGLLDVLLGSLANGFDKAGVTPLGNLILQLDSALGSLLNALATGDTSGLTTLLGGSGLFTGSL